VSVEAVAGIGRMIPAHSLKVDQASPWTVVWECPHRQQSARRQVAEAGQRGGTPQLLVQEVKKMDGKRMFPLC